MEGEMKDNRTDWELHQDGDCEFDCPFCFGEYEDDCDEPLTYDDEY
jgi:hypothetical protein